MTERRSCFLYTYGHDGIFTLLMLKNLYFKWSANVLLQGNPIFLKCVTVIALTLHFPSLYIKFEVVLTEV